MGAGPCLAVWAGQHRVIIAFQAALNGPGTVCSASAAAVGQDTPGAPRGQSRSGGSGRDGRLPVGCPRPGAAPPSRDLCVRLPVAAGRRNPDESVRGRARPPAPGAAPAAPLKNASSGLAKAKR